MAAPHGALRLRRRHRLARLGAVVVVYGVVYGAVMGSFGGVGPDRLLQIGYSAIKVPLLLTVIFAINLPSFFVLNTLLGVRADFGAALDTLVSTQAALTTVLAALAPYTALWYLSESSYGAAIAFNGAMFAVASASAQVVLARGYRPLVARDPRHRQLRLVWLAGYVLVGIQAAWVLRPFVGHPALPTRFFRADAWSNAYVFVARLVWDLVGG